MVVAVFGGDCCCCCLCFRLARRRALVVDACAVAHRKPDELIAAESAFPCLRVVDREDKDDDVTRLLLYGVEGTDGVDIKS